jgi:hypothetical protein
MAQKTAKLNLHAGVLWKPKQRFDYYNIHTQLAGMPRLQNCNSWIRKIYWENAVDCGKTARKR